MEYRVKTVSFLLITIFLAVSIGAGLLPGVLCACLGYISANAMTNTNHARRFKLSSNAAASIVIISPLFLLIFALINAKGMALNAIDQYASLMDHLAATVLELREKLPVIISEHIPNELSSIQTWLSQYLKSQSSAISHFGKVWFQGLVLAYVGLVIGALMRTSVKVENPILLRKEMRIRGVNFICSFKQIVMAQFWIASFNAISTAVLLFVILPVFGEKLPYSTTLVCFTFVVSMIPVVGNLICNGVLALTGVSVAPWVGLLCLIFLIVIHKTEYFISAKVLGKQTNTSVWELLSVIVVGEILFGMVGLIAAPLYYTYAKRELQEAKLI